MWGIYLGRLPSGCSRPPLRLHGQSHTRWSPSLPFGLHPLPGYLSMLVTMAMGVESGHLVHLSNTKHTQHTPPFTQRLVCVCDFGSHAWWSSGSLRPDYWPTNQLADHMGGNSSPTLCSAPSLRLHPSCPLSTPLRVSLLTTALLLTCSFFLMNHWLHLHSSGNSTLVIPHVSHWVLFPDPGGDSEGQAGAWCMETIRWDEILIIPLPKWDGCINK